MQLQHAEIVTQYKITHEFSKIQKTADGNPKNIWVNTQKKIDGTHYMLQMLNISSTKYFKKNDSG